MVRELTPELAAIAKDELNENPQTVPGDLKHLKEWISKQPHLRARTGTNTFFKSLFFKMTSPILGIFENIHETDTKNIRIPNNNLWNFELTLTLSFNAYFVGFFIVQMYLLIINEW